MTSYTPDALTMFNYDADMIIRNFLLKNADAFADYAKEMARNLHGSSSVVSPPDQVVKSFAVDRYHIMIGQLDRRLERNK